MDARETLERRIDELCRENEQLRQQVASIIGRSFRTADNLDCLETENTKLLDRVQELQAENAKLRGARDVWQENDVKLRELVRDIYESAYYEYPSYFESKFAARMRELGILEEA